MSCTGLLAKYAECLRHTECMTVRKRDIKECMAEKTPECEQYRYALFQCRRGQVDARTRIQGNTASYFMGPRICTAITENCSK